MLSREALGDDALEIDTRLVRDVAPDVLDGDGRLRVMPAAFWAATTVRERALFGHRHGAYVLPTIELVEHLAGLIDGRKAIEIGAGNGVLAQALGIPATDSRQQEDPRVQAIYRSMFSQPVVAYGSNVEHLHASRAVRVHKPQVVIGSWVTWKYDPTRPDAKGNDQGVDEFDVLRHCDTYILIGNTKVHAPGPLWERRHEVSHPPYLFSRAHNGTPDFIAVWQGIGRGLRR